MCAEHVALTARINALRAARDHLATLALQQGADPDVVREAAGTDTWRAAATGCDHERSGDHCHNDQPHKGGPDGLGCIHWGLTVADRHDQSEGQATA